MMNLPPQTNHVGSPTPRGSSPKSSTPKPKVRAGLGEDRKQEVRKMREMGSCTRCRIVRKPCAENTPRVTCSVIESPRSWKGFPCLRAKLVDLYQGYMLGLFQSLFSHEVDAAMFRMLFIPSSARLLVKYFDDASQFMLSALEGVTTDSAINPSPSVLSSGRGLVMKTFIVDNTATNLPTIFEKYVQKQAPRFL